MIPHPLSLEQARRVALHAQGLNSHSPFGLGLKGSLRAIEHLGYIQIDTISVIERAHHHVLWTRVPDYTPTLLHELQTSKKKVFEYWSHAASFLPFSDYRFCLPRMKALAEGQRHWFERNRKVMSFVLDRIKNEGPLLARDFEAPAGKRSGSWFDWKPTKRALEQLFMEGRLMVRERRGFQKVYDLAERVLPEGLDQRFPSEDEVARYLIRQAVRTQGWVLEPETRYLRKKMQTPIREALKELTESGELTCARLEESSEKTIFYASAAAIESASHPSEDRQSSDALSYVRLLSPFDNLVIQRKRLQRLFKFDYLIECYVPESKRKHGYFCLPLLWGDRLIGRVDAKAERTTKTLRVIQLIYEPSFREKSRLKPYLAAELKRFAAFNGCDTIRFES